MKFGEAEAQVRAPPGTMMLPVTAFHPCWESAPSAPVCVGLTLLSEGQMERAKAACIADAWQMFPRFDDAELRMGALQDALLRYIIAHGTTDPNDVTVPCELWGEAAEYGIRDALTVEGARAIFDRIEALRIATSPAVAEASDEEIEMLSALAAETLPRLPTWKVARVRRMIRFCLDEIVGSVELSE